MKTSLSPLLLVIPLGFNGDADEPRLDVRLSPAIPASTSPRLAWGDFDGDGLADLAAARAGRLRVLRNQGDGGFVDVTALAGLPARGEVHVVLWNDFDLDGDLDLLTGGAAGIRLLAGDGRGQFVDATEFAGLGHVRSAVTSAAWLDFDRDERPDLQLATERGDLLFRNVGDGLFETVDLGLWPEGGGGNQAAMAGPGTVSVAPTGQRAALGAKGICAASLMDSLLGGCLGASAAPTLGLLMPLSIDFNVDSAGNVGIGTTAPGVKLDVEGDVRSSGQLVSTATSGAPLSVASTERVPNLNADRLDGLEASAFSQLGSTIEGAEITDGTITAADLAPGAVGPGSISASSVGTSELTDSSVTNTKLALGAVGSMHLATGAVGTNQLANGTILDSDVSALASIAGSKIAPDFGAQSITTTGPLSVAGLRTIPGTVNASVIGGSTANSAGNSMGVTIAGGGSTLAPNSATGDYASVGGGLSNTVDYLATVSGGSSNSAVGVYAAIGGGTLNNAGGAYATVPGGHSCSADGDFSFAAGRRASAGHDGAFVWADSQNAAFFSSAPDQFLVRAAGGVGINTLLPRAPLHVREGTGGVTANSNSIAVFERSTGGWVSINGPSGFSKGVLFGNSVSNASGGIVYDQGSVAPESMQFRTGGNDTQMFISSVGQVGINTTSPAFTLHVNGTAGKPGGGSWSVTSDARLKKNVQPLEESLERLLALRGVTFEYRDPASVGELFGERTGMIAQEVEQVFPDWVERAPDGYKRLTIRGFEALTVEALRELRTEKDLQIDALRKQLVVLRERLDEMSRLRVGQ